MVPFPEAVLVSAERGGRNQVFSRHVGHDVGRQQLRRGRGRGEVVIRHGRRAPASRAGRLVNGRARQRDRGAASAHRHAGGGDGTQRHGGRVLQRRDLHFLLVDERVQRRDGAVCAPQRRPRRRGDDDGQLGPLAKGGEIVRRRRRRAVVRGRGRVVCVAATAGDDVFWRRDDVRLTAERGGGARTVVSRHVFVLLAGADAAPAAAPGGVGACTAVPPLAVLHEDAGGDDEGDGDSGDGDANDHGVGDAWGGGGLDQRGRGDDADDGLREDALVEADEGAGRGLLEAACFEANKSWRTESTRC